MIRRKVTAWQKRMRELDEKRCEAEIAEVAARASAVTALRDLLVAAREKLAAVDPSQLTLPLGDA